jgi:two-component system, OmpR family, response regulator MprA
MTISETTPLQVIYVEDSQLQAELLRAGLSVYNIEVLHLANGDESLIEELSRGHYDDASAIILDVNIGELTGLQVARRLRANGDSRPIMLISSEEKPANEELMAIQAIFISKPFNFEQISDAIKRVAARA